MLYMIKWQNMGLNSSTIGHWLDTPSRIGMAVLLLMYLFLYLNILSIAVGFRTQN